MFRFQILTIFPELLEEFSHVGLVGRGVREGMLSIETTQLRSYAINTQGQIDDTPYGGGSGMLLRPEPAAEAIRKAKQQDPQALVVLFTPRGKKFSQSIARSFIQHHQEMGSGLILLCPRYEGVDQRIAERFVDIELSLGDYILMGGEVPAMTVIESTTRLLPGVLGNPQSLETESFEKDVLEYPQYTKPSEFEGMTVPDVLLSGHHEEIASWQRKVAIEDTILRRPELLRSRPVQGELSVALIHFPVTNKQGDIITSSITNLDLHDIARSARTYGMKHFYAAHPVKLMRRLAEKICEHWESGYGSTYNPNRSDALETLSIVSDLDDVLIDIETRTGSLPKLIVTSAKPSEKQISFEEMSALLRTQDEPHLLLLGTGWGLAQEVAERADYYLEPVVGPTDYNHLSVRGAAAVIFDRLLGIH